MKKKKGGGGGRKRKKRELYIKGRFLFYRYYRIVVRNNRPESRSISPRSRSRFSRKFLRMENRLISAREFFPTCSSFLFPVYIYTYSLEKGFVHGEVDEKFPSRLQRHELAALSVDINPLALPLPIPWE